jgi:pimeloyl-ACP methyl ester carboxylesterase
MASATDGEKNLIRDALMPWPVTLTFHLPPRFINPLGGIMKHHIITGGGDCQLNLVETGNPDGQPILFIHGFSQSWLQWSRQLGSDLARNHRMVALDLRGHGKSEKPHNGYDNSRLWADDVAAVIRELELERPILSGWSYGPIVILDYVRHYGEVAIGGIHFVSGITKLGSDAGMSVIAPAFLDLVPGFFSNDVGESVRSMESLLRLCFVAEPSHSDLYLMLGYNLSVPPFVRQALFARSLDNDDLLAKLKSPVLITHGADDAIVTMDAPNQHASLIPNVQLDIMPGVGHAPFWDDAPQFNRTLETFCEEKALAAR